MSDIQTAKIKTDCGKEYYFFKHTFRTGLLWAYEFIARNRHKLNMDLYIKDSGPAYYRNGKLENEPWKFIGSYRNGKELSKL